MLGPIWTLRLTDALLCLVLRFWSWRAAAARLLGCDGSLLEALGVLAGLVELGADDRDGLVAAGDRLQGCAHVLLLELELLLELLEVLHVLRARGLDSLALGRVELDRATSSLVGAVVVRGLLGLLLLHARDLGERGGAALLALLGGAVEDGAGALVVNGLDLGGGHFKEVGLGLGQILGALELRVVGRADALSAGSLGGDLGLGRLTRKLETALLGLVLLELGAELLDRRTGLLGTRLLGAVAIGLVLGLLGGKLRHEKLSVSTRSARRRAAMAADERRSTSASADFSLTAASDFRAMRRASSSAPRPSALVRRASASSTSSLRRVAMPMALASVASSCSRA